MVQVRVKDLERGMSMGVYFPTRTWGIQNLFNLKLVRNVVKTHKGKKKCFLH